MVSNYSGDNLNKKYKQISEEIKKCNKFWTPAEVFQICSKHFSWKSGVLSKIIPFGAKLYANISGESTNVVKPDLVVIDAIDTGLMNYRSSWRDNF